MEILLEQLLNKLNVSVTPICQFLCPQNPDCNAAERSRSWSNKTLSSFRNLTMKGKRVKPLLRRYSETMMTIVDWPNRDSPTTIPEVTNMLRRTPRAKYLDPSSLLTGFECANYLLESLIIGRFRLTDRQQEVSISASQSVRILKARFLMWGCWRESGMFACVLFYFVFSTRQ